MIQGPTFSELSHLLHKITLFSLDFYITFIKEHVSSENFSSFLEISYEPELKLKCAVTGFPGGSDSKESPCSAGDLGLIPESGRSPEKGNDYPLQYSFLENSVDRGAWWATVRGFAESDTTE